MLAIQLYFFVEFNGNWENVWNFVFWRRIGVFVCEIKWCPFFGEVGTKTMDTWTPLKSAFHTFGIVVASYAASAGVTLWRCIILWSRVFGCEISDMTWSVQFVFLLNRKVSRGNLRIFWQRKRQKVSDSNHLEDEILYFVSERIHWKDIHSHTRFILSHFVLRFVAFGFCVLVIRLCCLDICVERIEWMAENIEIFNFLSVFLPRGAS